MAIVKTSLLVAGFLYSTTRPRSKSVFFTPSTQFFRSDDSLTGGLRISRHTTFLAVNPVRTQYTGSKLFSLVLFSDFGTSIVYVIRGGMQIELICLALVCTSESNPRFDGFSNSSNSVEYEYRYSVDESKSKGPVMDRWEHRTGEYVKGAYSVLEPDGRIRIVDYEVDGGKGYHAVIRMNEPGVGLLSYQQLTKSMELFPAAALPVVAFRPNLSSRNARNEGKIWNYHSRSPYINDAKSYQKDHKVSATAQISTRVPANNTSTELPPSPVNYNVPHIRKLIHFVKPAAFILGKNAPEAGHEIKAVKRSPEKGEMVPNLSVSDRKDAEQRRIRNSKLVKRFKSMDELRTSTFENEGGPHQNKNPH